MSDRSQSQYAKQREASEATAVALSTERLPWHPAIKERFPHIERKDWRVLTDAIFPAAKTTEGVILALAYCDARKLDIFKRCVHIVPIWDGKQKKMIESVWPGISETRTTAMRTKQYAGCDEVEFGPDVEKTWKIKGGSDDQGNTYPDREYTVTFPQWARLTVYRVMNGERWACPGPKVYWLETYATQSRFIDSPNEMWRKRPYGQLEKCAEAAALRRAFPEEDSGPTAEEIGFDPRSGSPTIDGEAIHVDPDPPTSAPVENAKPDAATDRAQAAAQAEAQAQARAAQQNAEIERQEREAAAAKKKAEEKTAREAAQKLKDATAASEKAAAERAADAAKQKAATTTMRDVAQEVTQGASNAPPPINAGDGGFEAWLVDADQMETRAEPYTDAVQFANAVAVLCAGQPRTVIDDIFSANSGAVDDCYQASEIAGKILDAIVQPDPPTGGAPVTETTPPADTAAPTEQAPPEVEQNVAWNILPVEKTPKGFPHWPNYIASVKAELDKFTVADEAASWLEAQKPSYMGTGNNRSVQAETQIGRHFEAVIARLSAPAGVDEDRAKADAYLSEINSLTSETAIKDMATRGNVLEDLDRWSKSRPELFKEVRGAATVRLKALSGT